MLQIYLTDYQRDRPTLKALRRCVFHQEQQVPEALDFDGQDEQCQHIIAVVDDTPVATLRLRPLDGQTAKIERVAVLPSHRRRGIALAMLEFSLDQLKTQGIKTVQVHAQTYIQPLYDRLEFEPQGASFLEAGIEHVKMVRCI